MPQFDDEILASMTDEEREALKEIEEQEAGASEDDPEVNLDGVEKEPTLLPADEKAMREAEDAEGKEDAGKSGDEGAADGGASDDAGAADGDEGAGAESAAPAPILVADAPADAEAQLQKIAEDKAALVEKFDDGELTAKEYQQQLDALSKQERAIERALDKAQIAADMEAQRQVNEKERVINSFLSEVGIPRDPSNLRFLTLDGAVRLVASNEANANLGPREILQKAYDLCVEQGTMQAKTPPKQEQRQARKPIDAPKTLASVPAAEISDTDNARWAHISRIKDPDARERAFAQLSPAEQDAYLASGA